MLFYVIIVFPNDSKPFDGYVCEYIKQQKRKECDRKIESAFWFILNPICTYI